MAKRRRRGNKKDPSLFHILVIVALIFGGGLYAIRWYSTPDDTTVSAPDDAALAQFEEAQRLKGAGDLVGAMAVLDGAEAVLMESYFAPQVLLMRADIAASQGNGEAELLHLKTLTENYPQSPEQPEAAARYAALLQSAGEVGEAVEIFETLRENAPAEMRAAAFVGLGKAAEEEGDLEEARKQYRLAIADAEPGSPDWHTALDAIGTVNVEMIFSTSETSDCKYYSIESGDNLTAIGVKLNTTQGLLLRANGITDPGRIRVGQRLKYTPKDFKILVERGTCQIFLMDSEGIFKRYHTGLGMPGHETTLGKYTIGSKQKDPTWYPASGGVVPPGDPNNELGTRWMPMVPAEEGLPTDLGIHGTIAPETIGQYKSHGCPRMRKADVEELYDLVVRSTPVEVVEEIDWAAFG